MSKIVPTATTVIAAHETCELLGGLCSSDE